MMPEIAMCISDFNSYHLPSFPCDKCGECCRHVDLLAGKYDGTLLEFPFAHIGGVCVNLLPDNTCAVYNDRPVICNVEKVCEYMGMEKQEYFDMNIKACDELKRNFKI